jgi:kynurenine formamidase
MPDPLPEYPDLPRTGGGAPATWGLWGDGDRLGTLNFLGPDSARRGAACVRTGRSFPLDLPMDLLDPPLFGRDSVRHTVLGDDTTLGRDDLVSGWNTQSSSQWDGFRHIRDPLSGYYGGLQGAAHGVDVWAAHGIVGRAVLLDVARHRSAQGRPLDPSDADLVTAEDLDACLAEQGGRIEPGDIVLIRTGWVDWYRALDAPGRARVADRAAMRTPGLLADETTAAWFWDHRVAAAAADNPSFEAWPLCSGARDGEQPLHVRLLARLGMPIGELWDLGPLAEDCARVGSYDALLVSAPLRLAGGCGSPANAVAVR